MESQPKTRLLDGSESTYALGIEWARSCQGGEIIALQGPLGAGKTVLVKGIATGVGFQGEVTSPTFTLVHEYHGGRLPVIHIDLYRLEKPNDVMRLGLDEYLPGEGITVIEWPERFPGPLPKTTQWWELQIVSESIRKIFRISWLRRT